MIYIFGFIFMIIYIVYALMWLFYDLNIHPREVIHWNDPTFFPASWLSLQITLTFFAFLIGVFFWKTLILIKCIREFGQSELIVLRLQPLNPDKSAGLHPLGEICIKLSSVLLFFGIYIISHFVQAFISHPPYFQIAFGIEFPIYTFFAPFLFFYPLISVHNIMTSEKDRLLDQLSAKLGVEYVKLYNELTKKGEIIDKERIGQFINIRELYLEAGKMPTWPFDTGTLLKFLGTVALPILLMISELILYIHFT